ncbi:hypothetical protein CQW23_28214 [Capsicum baccatum]|uniref:Yippee domain-containing protein n=1 Tax=Capsicum baccatum TaxID=33114 RepID=A0A2G2VFZ8_CAPBA|nr:hypothetical protein CQW23_28214 [Capsicum baccatum]
MICRFNVELLDRENNLRQVNGNTVADVHCGRCGRLLGLKLIVVPHPFQNISEGRFLMKLCKLVYWNDDPMLFLKVDDPQDGDIDIDQLLKELYGGANVEQVPNEKDGRSTEQVPNEQVADKHDGGANIDQVPKEQDGGAN